MTGPDELTIRQHCCVNSARIQMPLKGRIEILEIKLNYREKLLDTQLFFFSFHTTLNHKFFLQKQTHQYRKHLRGLKFLTKRKIRFRNEQKFDRKRNSQNLIKSNVTCNQR